MVEPEQEQHDLDSQYRRPSGELGRRVGREMARDHLPENLWTIKLLDPQPADSILEVGFGPGIAVEMLLAHVKSGLVAGVDFSETMVSEVIARNQGAILAGRADLRYGEAGDLAYGDASFDKAFSIHSIYFWYEPLTALKELHRVLKPGGLLVITMLPKHKWPPNGAGAPQEYGTAECTPYFGIEVEEMMLQAGFSITRIETDPDATEQTNRSNFSVLGTK